MKRSDELKLNFSLGSEADLKPVELKDLFNKEETKTEETVQGSVNYSVASVGQILNRPYDEYYVFVYDTTGDYATDMNSLLTK